MATYEWEAGVTGSWLKGANWSGGVRPSAGDTAIIDAAPVGKPYHVAIDKPVTAGDVILDQAAAYLKVASTFDVGNLELQAGTLEMDGGTLTGTVTQEGDATFLVHKDQTSTLSDVTWNGTLAPVFQNFNRKHGDTPGTLAITGGITLNGADGTGPGTLSLVGEGYQSIISLIGINALDNVVITDSVGNISGIIDSDSTNFTFGSTADVQNVEFYFYNGATVTNLGLVSGGTYSAQTFVNDGTISGYGVRLFNGELTNNGTIATNANGSIYDPGGKFVNNNVISVGQGLYINASSIVNNGTASVASGAFLVLDTGNVRSGTHGAIDLDGGGLVVKGKFATGSLASELASYNVHFAGVGAGIGIDGSLDNAGATLTTTSGLGALYAYNTEIDGGAIVDTTGALDVLDTLDLEGVAYRGGDLTVPGELILGGGSTIARLDSSAPTITLSNSASLVLGETQVLSGVAINRSNVAGDRTGQIVLDQGALLDNTQITLAVNSEGFASDIISAASDKNYGTLGAGVAITVTGTPSYSYYDAIISVGANEGVVTVTAGSALNVTAAEFVNSGTIDVTSGTLAISGAIVNSGTITLDSASLLELGGTFTVDGFNSFTLSNTAVVIDGNLDLQGSTLTPGTGAVPDFELGDGAGITDGTLSVANGQTLVAGFDVPTVGYGEPFVTSLANNGIVSASGLVVDAVSGTGTIDLVSSSPGPVGLTYKGTSADGGFGAGQVVNFVAANSQLAFESPGDASTFAGTLANFSVGDSLLFIGEPKIKSASFSRSGIVVKFSSGTSTTLATSSALSGNLTIFVQRGGETFVTYSSAGNDTSPGWSDWSAGSWHSQAGEPEAAARNGIARLQPEHDLTHLWPTTAHPVAW